MEHWARRGGFVFRRRENGDMGGHPWTSGDISRDARWDIWGHALPKSGPLSRGTLWERVREGERGVEVRSGAKMLRSSAPRLHARPPHPGPLPQGEREDAGR